MSTAPSAKSGGRSPRLDQLLSSLGYCSRRDAGYWIKARRVTFQGEVVTDPTARLDPAGIQLDNEPLDHPTGILVLLNKPEGHVCSHNPSEGLSVFDLLPEHWGARNPLINTVGRLDRDTTGALIITDDGVTVHRWTSPKGKIDKVYLAHVDHPLEEYLIGEFASGELQLPDEPKPCLPATLKLVDETTAELSMHEGKFHQVKRMFSHFGWNVVSLHRQRFGKLTADDLAPGAWRDIRPEEVEGLRED